MPLPIVSPALINAQVLALDDSDPHVPFGNHVRVNTHPQLGLPVAPFVIWRAVSRDGAGLALRTDALFVDGLHRIVAAPFTLAPDNPVTAYIPLRPGENCIWARVTADPFQGTPQRPGPRRPGRPAGRPQANVRSASHLVASAAGSGIVASAYTTSARGPALAAERDTPPFSFSAPGIVEIRLAGSGSVLGVSWIESQSIPKLEFEPCGILNLPHQGGARYLSITGAIARAALRVLDQAPKRKPLHETIGAVAPAAAPAAGAVVEAARVNSLVAPLQPDLDSLVTDLSELPLAQRSAADIVDESNRVIGSAGQRRLDRLYQAQLDPGCAAFLGYKARDREFQSIEPALVFYWIAGFFRDFPSEFLIDPAFDSLVAQLPAANRFSTANDLIGAFKQAVVGLNGVEVTRESAEALEDVSDYIGIGTLAIADRSAPPLPVAPPHIERASHVGWMPEVPPAATREVELAIEGVTVGGMLAAEKQTPATGTERTQLNSANADNYHLPLVLGLNTDDSTLAPSAQPGSGFLNDRLAAVDPIRYYVAQQDRFGRWSEWTSEVSEPGARPRPPRPVIRATYTQAADPAAGGGTVRVRVDVPTLAALAPGSFPIQRLIVNGTFKSGVPVTRTVDIADPLNPPAEVEVSIAVPTIAPTKSRKLRLLAKWRDTSGTESVESEAQTLTMHDPRPPAQLAVPDTLLYSARPDVTGLSMVEHEWTPADGQSTFAVYYSDETRIRSFLARLDATEAEAALAARLNAQPDPAARATVLRSDGALIGAHLFERLQGVVFDAAGNRKVFRHAVSGSLRVLSVYRISAEAGTGASVDLTTLPLLIYAVPNADPAPKPTIEVVPAASTGDGDPFAALVKITLTPGAAPAARWRVRRSNLGARDVLRMPVAATGVMPDADADGRQRATFTDAGPVVIAPAATLQPWVRYHWVAEAQGALAPGSEAAGRPVQGIWSLPSDPASLVLVPAGPPEPASRVTVSGTAKRSGGFEDVVVRVEHPRTLMGGSVGSYRLRLERRIPDGVMESLAEIDVAGAGPFVMSGLRTNDGAEQPSAGTAYRVVVIDPLGRQSMATEAVLS